MQTYEAGIFPGTDTIHFPKSCLHCEEPPCVPVCPTGASYKRAEDGIVLVDYDKCIGCKYCAWACPYGAREIDEERQVMTKCTLCVDRIHDEQLPKEDRKPACVKACPDRRAPVRRREGSGLGGLDRHPRARRLFADARVADEAGEPVPAAPDHRGRRHPGAPCRVGDRADRPDVNPAFSVVFFTTLAGAAQGLVVALAVAALGGLAVGPGFTAAMLGVAAAMLVVGLGCSFLHLGRPERAWRAATMWRTSWLSREVIVLPAFIAVVVLWWAARADGRLAAVDAIRVSRRRPGPRRAPLAVHGDDLRLPALHRGVGASADARELRARRPVLRASCSLPPRRALAAKAILRAGAVRRRCS